MICGHQYGEFKCGLNAGHHGIHSFYEMTSGEGDESSFVVREWNSIGETAKQEIGNAFPCDYDAGEQERQKIMNLAIFDARANLPKGTVFEIRAKEYPNDSGKHEDFGRKFISREDMAKSWGIAWYVVPKQPLGFEHLETKTSPLVQFATDNGEPNELGGYVLLARIEA